MVTTGTTRAEQVTLTSGTHVYFQGENNHRERQFEAMLPASSEPFAQAILHFKLSCPDGLCDGWDRFGSFGMLDAQGRYFELMRFITPYGIGAEWAFDISPFLPLLQGKANFRVFIDTWVGPGHPKGNGWLVDASIQYIPGVLDQRPVHVLPLLSEANIVYGDPSFTYNVELYDNTCRPGVISCLGCTLGTGCEFDGGRHTEPRYYVSTYAVYYQ